MVDRIQLPEGVPPLTEYYAYLTGGCNLACQHCWIAPSYQATGGTGGHLDYDLLALAIEEALPLGLGFVKLTGGEPLLHPEFTRIVDLLYEKKLGVTIETNGTLLTPELARFLKDKGNINAISVSLDGANPATHDAFRGVKGSFEKTCKAVGYLVDVGFRPQVIMSIHPGNFDEIEPLVNLAQEMGAGSVKFNLIQPSGRGKVMTERGKVSDVETLIRLGQWVENDLGKRSKIPLLYSWPIAYFSIKRLLSFSGYTCSLVNILGILSTGQISMCGIGLQVPDLIYGQIGKDRIIDIWTNHPILDTIRKKLPGEFEGICADCEFKGTCLGMCVAENYLVSKRITAPGWFCQDADNQHLFPKSRKRIKEEIKNETNEIR